MLYECEVRRLPLGATLEERVAAGEPPANEYTLTLVRGVAERQARIDEVIATYARDWSLERMPAVDRNALRIGVFEVLFAEDVPDAVAVSEALHLVRDLSTDESPAFVNGILGSILRDKAALSA